MIVRKSKVYVSPEDFYTVEEIMLNYHHEYLVFKNDKKDESGEYFKTLQQALQYVADNCNY